MWCLKNLLYFVVLTGVYVESEKRSFDKIDTKVIPDDGSFFPAAIRKLEDVKEQIEAQSTFNGAAEKAVDLLPMLSTGIQYIGETYGTTEAQWLNLLLNKIMEATESTTVRTQYDSIRVSARTIGQLFRQMQSASSTDQIAITHDINTKLLDIFNTFRVSENALEKYPHLAIPTLLELAPLMFVVEEIFKIKRPELLTQWFYSCRLVDLLKKYRMLTLFYRMSGLRVPFTTTKTDFNAIQPPFKHIGNVLRKPFDRYGYNETNRDYVECQEFDHCRSLGIKSDRCFEDTRIDAEIALARYEVIGDGYHFDNTCVQQYVELLRLRVERTFQRSIDTLEEKLCTAALQSKRDPTVYGRLTIAVTDIHDYDGFRVFVDDKQIHSFMRWDDQKQSNFYPFDRKHTMLFQVIASKEMIRVFSVIRFEMITCHTDGWKQFFRDLVLMDRVCDSVSTDKQWQKGIDDIKATVRDSVDGIGRNEENGLVYLTFWEQFYKDSV